LFLFYFCGSGTILGEKWLRISSKTPDAQPGSRIDNRLEHRRTAEFTLAAHPEPEKTGVAPEWR
jgi:hypothetical protein